jgi:phospholipase C
MADSAVKRVVILVQENHTTDNYFAGLAPWGANVATGWRAAPNPPPQPPFSAGYPRHDRHAHFDWLTGGTRQAAVRDHETTSSMIRARPRLPLSTSGRQPQAITSDLATLLPWNGLGMLGTIPCECPCH